MPLSQFLVIANVVGIPLLVGAPLQSLAPSSHGAVVRVLQRNRTNRIYMHKGTYYKELVPIIIEAGKKTQESRWFSPSTKGWQA